MKVKVIKIGIVMSLLLGVLVTSPLAGDSAFSRYNIASSGKNWYEAPGSYNTKASSGMPWFIRVNKLDTNGYSLNGGWGMAYCPMVNGSTASANYHWTTTTHSNNVSVSWGSNYGAVNIKYVLGMRLDSIYTGYKGVSTVGYWNAY